MRTKALILSAALCVAGLTSAVAQNVYSVNVVGYTTVTLTNAWAMIANQLDDGAGNYATNHITSAPTGLAIYKFNPASGGYLSMSRGPTAWFGQTFIAIGPGEGIFIKKPASPASVALTFVGEVMQGELINPVTSGFDIYSAMVPQQGGIQAVHGYVPENGDTIFQFLPASGGYRSSSYSSAALRWFPSEPNLAVNESFWIKSISNKNWTRTFTVQ